MYVGRRFRIEKCRHRTAGLADVLEGAMATLEPALEDLKNGADSTHGFKAFFKHDGAKEYVQDMLNSIRARESLPGLLPNPRTVLTPRFACAQEDSRSSYPWLLPGSDPWIVCRSGRSPAFYTFTTAYIWICPNFFRIPTKPNDIKGRDCPIVRDNQFIGHAAHFLDYQTYIVIHELVHFYLQSQSLTGITYPLEQYSLNNCVALIPLHSLHNPTSYQAYIASEYLQRSRPSWRATKDHY